VDLLPLLPTTSIPLPTTEHVSYFEIKKLKKKQILSSKIKLLNRVNSHANFFPGIHSVLRKKIPAHVKNNPGNVILVL
jgi:hypothetical protein